MTIKPAPTKNRGISAVWILPIIAIAICGWLLYDNYKNGDVGITLFFDAANGIEAGKTPILLKGIKIGVVKEVKPDFERDKLRVVAKVKREVSQNLASDTLFWVVKPELSINKITGLDTLFSGNYIETRIGKSPEIAEEFEGLTTSPPISSDAPGLHIKLETKYLGSIQKGTGIYYRNIEIGSVQDYQLKGQVGVSIDAYITPEYKYLVHKESRFCNVSGLSIEGKLPDIKIRMESFAALIKGGLLLQTPTHLANSPLATNGMKYDIYKDFDAATYGITMELKLPSLYNITEGVTPVIYHGVKVGKVQRINLNPDDEAISATVLIDPRAEMILRKGTQFWLVEPELGIQGVKNIDTILSGSYISFQLDKTSTEYQDVFEMSPEAPALAPLRKGKIFHLRSKNISFAGESPIYFKGIKVGEVIDSKLVKSGHEIITDIYIYNEHLNLLSSKSVFWQYSGINMQADLSGLNLEIGPLAKVVGGGLSFTSPEKIQKKKNRPPKDGATFQVYRSFEKAVEEVVALQKPGIKINIAVKEASSLKVGSPIIYTNINIGKVTGFEFSEGNHSIIANCFIEKQYAKLINNRSRFFDYSGVQVKGNLHGVSLRTGSLEAVINGGIGCFTPSDGKSKKANEPYQLYESFDDAVLAMATIRVQFDDLGGLQEGAAVMYKGIQVGQVSKLTLAADLQTTTASIMVEERILPLFRTGTMVWLEKAKLSLQEVKNLDAVILGPTISFLPGKGALTRNFKALAEEPKILSQTGFSLNLKAKRLNSIVKGSPIYYKQVPVGKVVGFSLNKESGYEDIDIEINIKPKYKDIINQNTKFWFSTGLTVEAGLFSGVDIRTESLEAFLIGGISFGNPKKKKNKKGIAPVKAGQDFIVHEKPEDSWL